MNYQKLRFKPNGTYQLRLPGRLLEIFKQSPNTVATFIFVSVYFCYNTKKNRIKNKSSTVLP